MIERYAIAMSDCNQFSIVGNVKYVMNLQRKGDIRRGT